MAQVVPVPQPTPSHNVSQKVVDGKEVYHVGIPSTSTPPAPVEATPTPAAPILEMDDVNASVEVGALCRRNGCNAAFVSDEVNRQGDGEGTKCHYHPLPVRQPIYPFQTCRSNENPFSRTLGKGARYGGRSS